VGNALPPDDGFGFDDPKLAREMAVSAPRIVAVAPAPVLLPVAQVVRSPVPVAPPRFLSAPLPVPVGAPHAPRSLVVSTPSPPPLPPPSAVPSARPTRPAPAPQRRLALVDSPSLAASHSASAAAAPRETRRVVAAADADLVQKHPPSRDNAAARLAPAPLDRSGSATDAPPDSPWQYAPRFKLSYRQFSFAHAVSAAPAITQGTTLPTTPETFQSVSLDLYPMSWYLRVGLSTQFGWESGQFDRTGDYFLAESASVGFQLPGRFTPFVEGFAGAGYMRRKQGTANLHSGYWQLGVDAGVEIYFAKRAYLSLAVGYLHPVNLFLDQQNLSSVKADTWALKIGLGI
jgi:hypothetical protein